MNSFVVLLCVVPLIVSGNERYDTYGGNLGIDCSKLADGNYPDPNGHPPNCNTFYWVCASHEAKKMDCQNGLYFDPDRNWCESRDNVVVCGGQQATTLPPADDVTLDRKLRLYKTSLSCVSCFSFGFSVSFRLLRKRRWLFSESERRLQSNLLQLQRRFGERTFLPKRFNFRPRNDDLQQTRRNVHLHWNPTYDCYYRSASNFCSTTK